MERLANAPPAAPPNRLASWQRWWNKKLGHPSTPDVAILASLLTTLQTSASQTLGQPITHVAMTFPPIPALAALDVADALEHAGLHHWLGDTRGRQAKHVSPSRAVFAAHGHGLCVTYPNMHRCWNEEWDMPWRRVLFVSLTRHALYVSLERMKEAFTRFPRDGPRVLDFEGGLDKRGGFGGEDEYWAYIRGQIVAVARRGEGPVEMVLVGGENATESGFLETLRDALAEIGPGLLPSVDGAVVVDPTYAAARGMALYARRRHEVPGTCMELERCEEKRERERAGGGQSRVDL